MKKVYLLFTIYYLLFSHPTYSQNDVNSVLDKTLSYRGLTREDVTIPIEFFSAAEKSPTNDSKLILPLVKDMMVHPLRAMTWLDSISEWTNYPLKTELIKSFSLLKSDKENSLLSDTFYMDYVIRSPSLESLFNDMISIVKYAKKRKKDLLKDLWPEEIDFLHNNLFSILEESESDDPGNFDIFKYNRERDSSNAISKRTMDILSKLDMNKIRENSFTEFADCYRYIEYLLGDFNFFKNEPLEHISNEHVQGDFYFYYDKDGIRIAIGGPGKNVYNGHFDFIVDVGGDDVYNIENEKDSFGGFSCIIDLAGNDTYRTKSSFALAG